MIRMILAAFAAIAIAFASLAAPIPQASQAWVDMKLEQMRQRILSEVSSFGSATNPSAPTTISTDVAASMADISPIVSLLFTSSPPPSTDGVPYYTAGSCSPTLTNFITSGYVLSQTASNVFSNTGVVLTEGTATNTISVGGSYTLHAPSGTSMYIDSANNFAFFFKGYATEE